MIVNLFYLRFWDLSLNHFLILNTIINLDAQNTYEEEMNNASEEDRDSIDFTISDDGSAYLSSYDGEYEWTWEVIEV